MADKDDVYKADEIKDGDVTRYTDDAGNTIEYVEHDGLHQPLYELKIGAVPDFRANIKRIQGMPCRESDVFICAYPKAGTHWVWEITRMLVKGTTEYEKESKETVTTEFHLPEEFEAIPSPRVFNTHLPFRHLPKGIVKKRCKMIFIQRNPKDVAVSFYNHTKNFDYLFYNGDWDHYLKLFLSEKIFYQGWFQYTSEWETVMTDNSHIDFLKLYYEDLTKDPLSEIAKIGTFLDVEFDDKFVAAIAEKCSFKNLKTANVSKEYTFSNNQQIDVGLMFRKGKVGDWKNWFTVAQSEEFDTVYRNKMKDSKFQYSYSVA
ncbi:sulfotransferase family cytosolic 1B member 1-like [Mizuhopecten yessoensis]|uniref:Sulfotransferase family cytosolic 1B member 1 n=1 Tax=Mizuhopecten yessoensis TaxID=6573 RepID=A0A210Q896_MIZYE|nr:sulfotransferase family cytosolic 1B member 1-like [Mizuhopecten yessoensis]OWF44954.1 Sulfotransferase family cytosolic 1B member 1 [Mizuhopecten yessoensis]